MDQKMSFLKNNIKIKLIFITVFSLFALIVFIFLYFVKNYEINKHLENKTQSFIKGYHTIYESYHTLALEVFDTLIDTKEVKDIFKNALIADKKDKAREALFEKLEPTYKILNRYNIKQLHFHLKNSESFLRFHRPSKYGDNLSSVRETVKYVNEHKKAVDSFEEGRIYNGYRFVFPLFVNKTHIGSVEISFSTLMMSTDFMKTFHVVAPFLVLKEKIEAKVFKDEKRNYVKSQFKRFHIEKKLVEKVSDFMTNTSEEKVSQKVKDIIQKRALDTYSFSLYDSKIEKILTFIKVKNTLSKEVVGLFVIESSAEYIGKLNFYFYFLFFIVLLVMSLVFIILYKEFSNKKTLENKIKLEVVKSRIQDQKLIQQSRLAQMGEMISMIAHQWRQPLAAISSLSTAMELKSKLGTLDNKSVAELSHTITQHSKHLSETIDDFREFFKPNKELSKTNFNEIIQNVLGIVGSSISNNNIEIMQELECHESFDTYPNELKQVVLNLLKNAEDALLDNEIEHPFIKIRSFTEQNSYILQIRDNAGGIPEEIMDKVFDPYFSTKTKKDGTGLGLYMSKTIIEEHCKGHLHVSNDKEGAIFEIILKDSKD